jgi:hypothetical protein
MPVRHGVSGYQSGCRCDVCVLSESARTRQIALKEKRRWNTINKAIDDGAKIEQSGPPPHTRRRRWTNAKIALVDEGKLADQELAKRVGRSVESIAALPNRRTRPTLPSSRPRLWDATFRCLLSSDTRRVSRLPATSGTR